MAISISPLDILLDENNPRFVILASREQSEIRKYLITYEDVCQLATAINEYGSLLPGERIVVLQENGRYVAIEGNRRTCSLQLLLSRDLIPEGFAHRIPSTTQRLIDNCSTIEVDVLPSRDAALELMTKRHIEGVKEWKPLAKKQFFAANYKDGQGQSVSALSRITGIREGIIKEDIRDYKFFYSVYEKYAALHPDFNREIVVLKTDPFWRIFKAKFSFADRHHVSPKDFLMLCYDETYNTISRLPDTLFEQIAQLVFEQTIVLERINTRNVLSDVEGIQPLLQAVIDCSTQAEGNDDASGQNDDQSGHNPPNAQSNDSVGRQTDNANNEGSLSATVQNQPSTDGTRYAHSSPISNPQNENRPDLPQPGGPRPGGPSPRTFFETIDWHRLNPSDSDHQGLLFAIDELYKLSTKDCERQKAYKKFPIATGMVLRTVYEQALRLRLKQVRLWGTYLQQQNGRLPMLSSIETFINQQNNKNAVFPEHDMILVFDRVIAAGHREFLNENIHYPGNINVTAESLESIAAGGMFRLIQWILEKTN